LRPRLPRNSALLLFEEQGKLSLDDKVAKYFPNLTRAGKSPFANCSRTYPDMKITRHRITSSRSGRNPPHRRPFSNAGPGSPELGTLTKQIAAIAFLPDQPPESETVTQQVRSILEQLRNGRINRALFTGYANSYFSETALKDCRTLSKLGKLQSVTRSTESERGDMIHRTYRAQFEKKMVLLNIYVTRDGKYEQFLVMNQL
jgi:hypothetical protein